MNIRLNFFHGNSLFHFEKFHEKKTGFEVNTFITNIIAVEFNFQNMSIDEDSCCRRG